MELAINAPVVDKTAKKRSRFVLLLCLVTTATLATILTIDTRGSNYRNLSNVQGTNYQTEVEVRTAGLTQIAARYRLLNGMDKLPAGTEFRVIYGDGSSEHASVTTPYSSMGSVPIPGTGIPGMGGPCDLSPCGEYAPH